MTGRATGLRAARVALSGALLALAGLGALAAPSGLPDGSGLAPAHEPTPGHAHPHAVPAVAPPDAPAAPAGLVRRLDDVQRRSGRGRIAWQTFWTLCWQPVPGAVRYEARWLTSEGAPRRPTPVDRGCHRVEVAAGENAAAAGLYRRDLMLAMQAAQSSVQVRAVFADGRTTAWTAEQPVGGVGSDGR